MTEKSRMATYKNGAIILYGDGGERIMVDHNKLTFTAEYCRARRIPYRIKREALFINGTQICYSLYNLTYIDIIKMIDNEVEYDATSTFYIRTKPNVIYEI